MVSLIEILRRIGVRVLSQYFTASESRNGAEWGRDRVASVGVVWFPAPSGKVKSREGSGQMTYPEP